MKGSWFGGGRRVAWVALLLWLPACGGVQRSRDAHAAGGHIQAAAAAGGAGGTSQASPSQLRTITIISTNDMHGNVARIPLLSGYIERARDVRRSDGGGVLLLDAGDMFQGTLESNAFEGQVVVAAMNAMAYDAAAIGNHEFDYGPVGPAVIATSPKEDPRGALAARIREAHFPILSSNVISPGKDPHAWAPVRDSVIKQVAGVDVGIIGATTETLKDVTLLDNVVDLTVLPVVDTVTREAAKLRAQGADIIVLTAHLGGKCRNLGDSDAVASCEPDQEVNRLAKAFKPGTVDAIVAGHTHAGVAHRIAGIPVIEAFAYTRAFGRIDLTVDVTNSKVVASKIFPPRWLCAKSEHAQDEPEAGCTGGEYEGATVQENPIVSEVIAPYLIKVEKRAQEKLGPVIEGNLPLSSKPEFALGNLFTDWMRKVRPSVDAAIVNRGGLRRPLAAGPLTYGALYELFPFDNTFAHLRMRGAGLKRLFRNSFYMGASRMGDRRLVSVSGVRAEFGCDGSHMTVSLFRENGKPIADDEPITVLVTNFLATGGDGLMEGIKLDKGAIKQETQPLRELIARYLRRTKTVIKHDDKRIYDPEHGRMTLPHDGACVSANAP